ncbi:DUF4123 domain-containing protein, partial [Pseudovibrio axinellae]
SDGRLVRFRFFDPAVLRVWLLSTNPLETQAFFGPITDFIAEDWCEEPSLCHDHQLWHFAAPRPGEHCTANRFDMQTRQLTPMTPFAESSTQTNDRPKGHITLIRKAQEKAFEDMQWELFVAKVAQKIFQAGNLPQEQFLTFTDVQNFARDRVDEAIENGVETIEDLNEHLHKKFNIKDSIRGTNDEKK